MYTGARTAVEAAVGSLLGPHFEAASIIARRMVVDSNGAHERATILRSSAHYTFHPAVQRHEQPGLQCAAALVHAYLHLTHLLCCDSFMHSAWLLRPQDVQRVDIEHHRHWGAPRGQNQRREAYAQCQEGEPFGPARCSRPRSCRVVSTFMHSHEDFWLSDTKSIAPLCGSVRNMDPTTCCPLELLHTSTREVMIKSHGMLQTQNPVVIGGTAAD